MSEFTRAVDKDSSQIPLNHDQYLGSSGSDVPDGDEHSLEAHSDAANQVGDNSKRKFALRRFKPFAGNGTRETDADAKENFDSGFPNPDHQIGTNMNANAGFDNNEQADNGKVDETAHVDPGDNEQANEAEVVETAYVDPCLKRHEEAARLIVKSFHAKLSFDVPQVDGTNHEDSSHPRHSGQTTDLVQPSAHFRS